MAGLDIKSIVVTCETKVSSASAPSVEAGHKLNAYSKASPAANNESYGPAVEINPIFIMTPDGVLHIKIDQKNHTPEITLSSFNMAKNSKGD